MTFNKSNLNTIRADVAAALAAVEKKHRVNFKMGNIRYGADDFRCKLECFSTSDSKGNTVDPAEENFKRDAFLIGVAKDAFGKTFKSGRSNYKITGINRRRHKFPISAIRVASGRSYKFPVSSLPARLQA